jgi:hypothetical protein
VKEVKAEALGDKAQVCVVCTSRVPHVLCDRACARARTQIESFEQEAVKMSQLRPHHNVITLYGVCQVRVRRARAWCVIV